MAEAVKEKVDSRSGPERPANLVIPPKLPVLPLSDLVVFPDMAVPLLVSTPQSIQLIDDVVAGDRLVAVTLQKEPDENHPRPEQLHEVGCAARVLRMLKFPDESVRVLIQGLKRIRLTNFEKTGSYLVAQVVSLEDEVEPGVAPPATVTTMASQSVARAR